MACPGTPCTPLPAPDSWTFTGNPASPVFQDARLIGLRKEDASVGFGLVGIDPVAGELYQPDAPKGVVQHDPASCGPFYIGPLNDPPFQNVPLADVNKGHRLAMWQADCDGKNLHLVKLDPQDFTTGRILITRDEACGGGEIPGLMSPEALGDGYLDANDVAINPLMLGSVPFQREVSPGVFVTDQRWYSVTQWHQATVVAATEDDTVVETDGDDATLEIAAWKEVTGPGGGTSKLLVRIPQEQYERLVRRNSFKQVTRTMIFEQVRSGGAVFTPSSVNYDVSTHPEYTPDAIGVVLVVRMAANTQDGLFDLVLDVNGRNRGYLNLGKPNSGNSDQDHMTVDIPDNKTLTVAASANTYDDGVVDNSLIRVWIDAFVY